VLINLLGNAVKFTSAGEIVVRVSVESETDAAANVRFAVSDTGIGIDAAARARIFEPFAQADASTSRRFGGTGLGLAISRQLVDLMRGSLALESRPGEGSTFSFTLPFEKRGGGATAAAAQTPLAGRRVLVVDAHPTSREMLVQEMESWGVSAAAVASAMRAREAIADAREAGHPFEMAIVEQTLADGDGMALGASLQTPGAPAVPLVLLTSVRQAGEAARARAAGFAAYITKPVRHQQLRDALATVLHLTQAPADTQPPMVTRHTLAEMQARGKARILVVEDNLVNQKVAVRLVEKLGYRVDVVSNGVEAVDAVAKMHFDALLMDCQMPEMDGYAATVAIRQTEAAGRRVPIIAMTANALEGDRETCLAAGMDDYLSKPINVGELRAALARWTGAPAA
jgi:CheY-like chemotaxis protein